jgi:type IV pilus assembly protein PilQ
MSVLITKNDLASVVDGVPSLSTNEAETELLVNDGNTIVIGGIVKNTSSAAESGFPGLSNIPFLGRLFGSDTTEDNKNELLIFITPTIVQLEQRDN